MVNTKANCFHVQYGIVVHYNNKSRHMFDEIDCVNLLLNIDKVTIVNVVIMVHYLYVQFMVQWCLLRCFQL